MDKFNLICHQIKENKNYKSAINNDEFLALIPQPLLAITPAIYQTPLGLLYEIKKIESKPSRHVNDSLHLLVRYDGEVSFHERTAVVANNFDYGIPWLLLRHVLHS